MNNYKRTLEELRKYAVLHWPDEIVATAKEASSLELLLQTQDNFISILNIADKEPLSWKSTLECTNKIGGSLFLKHLMLLSDIGGEALNKLPPLKKYIPDGKMVFIWDNKPFEYVFKEIGEKCTLTNSGLGLDAKKLSKRMPLCDKGIDVSMLILFGAQLQNDSLPAEIKEKCVISDYLGHIEALNVFVKQRYIFVSKLMSGAQANALGQLAQRYVATTLKNKLGSAWTVQVDSVLPGVFHTENSKGTNFDLVVCSPERKYFGIEVSFQVTTNSTIERKARESEAVMNSVHAHGHKICYVIDGAGNINIRENAVKTLCNHSDCTIAMSEKEIEILAEYVKSV